MRRATRWIFFLLCPAAGCAEQEPSTVTWERAPADWIQASPMNEPRFAPAAAVLADGRVLVAGGYAPGYELRSAEVFDARTDTWQKAAPMSAPRIWSAAVLLQDGRVLVAGGSNQLFDEDGQAKTPHYLADAEIYDPATDTWALTSPMNRPHTAATATLLPDGRVLLAGGSGDDELDKDGLFAELFDPSSGTWSFAGAAVQARHAHTATLLPGGAVILVGGYDAHEPLKSAERYDPASAAMVGQSSMAFSRREHVAALLSEGPHAGHVLVAGGATAPNDPLATAEVFDPVLDAWSPLPPMLEPHGRPGNAILPDGSVAVVGGIRGDGQSPSAAVEVYVPAENLWRALPPIHEARASPVVLRRGSMLLVAGGVRDDGLPFASVEVFMADLPCTSTADCFAGYSCSPGGLCGVEEGME